MIRVTQLVKEFEGATVRAVDDISFEVPTGSLVTLLGPSGCGKTTTLRSIAGLERPTSGEIQIGDRVVFSSTKRVLLPPNRRSVGMVFQSYAIWPHMTVYENVAYPLKNTRRNGTEVRERTMRALELVGLQDYAKRPAPKLSGGQQQRVALARAVVAEPEVLLFDEPLSNLDAKLRESMRQEVRDLQQRLGLTALYVTHDQAEALAISDIIAIMSGGKIVEFGSPQQIYEAPKSRFAAQFIGQANVVTVRDISVQDPASQGVCELGPIRFTTRHPDRADIVATVGRELPVLLRPEDIQLSREQPTETENVWRCTVRTAAFLGTYFDTTLEANGYRLRVQAPRGLRLRAGEEIYATIPWASCIPLQDHGAVDRPLLEETVRLAGSPAPAAQPV